MEYSVSTPGVTDAVLMAELKDTTLQRSKYAGGEQVTGGDSMFQINRNGAFSLNSQMETDRKGLNEIIDQVVGAKKRATGFYTTEQSMIVEPIRETSFVRLPTQLDPKTKQELISNTVSTEGEKEIEQAKQDFLESTEAAKP